MSRVLVIGSANIDIVFRTHRLPAPGETVLGGDLAKHFGGKGANQAVAACRLGADVTFMAMLGNDADADAYRTHLASEGIDLSWLAESADSPTGNALITVDDAGNNTIVVSAGANRDLRVEKVPMLSQAIASCELVLLQFEIPFETNLYAIRKANELGKIVILNPSPMRPDFLSEGLTIDYLILNEGELAQLSEMSILSDGDITRAARTILERGVRRLVVTRGAESTVAISPAEEVFVPTKPVIPVDTVAAGDTFAGAFAVALSRGIPLRRAIEFANSAGALATLRHGAQSSIPTLNELEVFLAQENATEF